MKPTLKHVNEAFPINAANEPIQKNLYFVWEVTGSFDNHNRLRWTLTTADARLANGVCADRKAGAVPQGALVRSGP